MRVVYVLSVTYLFFSHTIGNACFNKFWIYWCSSTWWHTKGKYVTAKNGDGKSFVKNEMYVVANGGFTEYRELKMSRFIEYIK
jgi:glucosamine 6-phosphate synthetase-like amidotransferase/phosphosugar isomerase protein